MTSSLGSAPRPDHRRVACAGATSAGVLTRDRSQLYMYLIQLLLPLYDNEGRLFPHADFDRIREALTARFGGVTAFVRVPAEGAWQEGGGTVSHDEVVILEVMADELAHDWWAQYREELRCHFRQKDLVIRAIRIERL